MLGRWSNGRGREMSQRGGDEEEGALEELMSRPLVGLQRQINRVFEEFFDDFEEDFPRSRPGGRRGGEGKGGPWAMGRFRPTLDFSETGDAFRIIADVPGMTAEDMEISVLDNRLMISGDRSMEEEAGGENYYRRERSYGRFRRQIPLPDNIEREAISATFKNGVLTIEVPKNEEAQQNWRTIEVKSQD